jgi:hypothetical protein
MHDAQSRPSWSSADPHHHHSPHHPPQQAIHGLSPEQSQNGFVLTCQSHPAGPGLELELGLYDVVYETQYGQYERKAESEGKKKSFNVFG